MGDEKQRPDTARLRAEGVVRRFASYSSRVGSHPRSGAIEQLTNDIADQIRVAMETDK